MDRASHCWCQFTVKKKPQQVIFLNFILLTLKVTVLVASPLRLMKVCGLKCHLSASRVGAMNG